MQKHLATGIIAGAFLIGTAGAALVLPGIADAADPSPSPAATSGIRRRPAPGRHDDGHPPATGPARRPPARPAAGGGHGGPGGLDADDLTAAAGALGMTEADLTTALQGGKTVAAVADDKGVDLQKVIDAIVAADKAEIDAAVTAGTMTQAQADERLANLDRARDRRGQRRGRRTGRPRRLGPRWPGGLDADDLTAAAGALGMTEADLTTALQGGRGGRGRHDKGVDLQKVIDAIVAADKAEITAAVTAGTMTQAQADERLANLAAHVTDEVNGVAGGPGGHGRHRPDGQAPAGPARAPAAAAPAAAALPAGSRGRRQSAPAAHVGSLRTGAGPVRLGGLEGRGAGPRPVPGRATS